MPIYEFYCRTCNTLFNFLSRRIDTTSRPPCPRCKRPLSREVSAFAAPRGAASSAPAGGDAGPSSADEARMEQAMERMAGQLESVNDDDPRQAARVMRQFAEVSGMRFNGTIDEALGRMEAGEDPDRIESEYGEALDNPNPFADDGPDGASDGDKGKPRARRRAAPRRDPTLHEM